MRKWLGMVGVAAVMVGLVLALGGGTVFAQGGDEDTAPPCGFLGGGWGGHWMMGGRFGWPGGACAEDTLFGAVAEALGLEPADLWDQLRDGKTVAELAEEQGVELSAIVEAVVAAHGDRLAQAVEDGSLTQAQADAMQALLRANLDAWLSGEGDFPMLQGLHFGPGGMMGGRFSGGFGGRMGRGMGFWGR